MLASPRQVDPFATDAKRSATLTSWSEFGCSKGHLEEASNPACVGSDGSSFEPGPNLTHAASLLAPRCRILS